jgi:hypothetical protein
VTGGALEARDAPAQSIDHRPEVEHGNEQAGDHQCDAREREPDEFYGFLGHAPCYTRFRRPRPHVPWWTRARHRASVDA